MAKKNDKVIIVPWSNLQVANLAELQKHCKQYKCPICKTQLTPLRDGWLCEACGYDRDWAHTIDASGETLKRRLR